MFYICDTIYNKVNINNFIMENFPELNSNIDGTNDDDGKKAKRTLNRFPSAIPEIISRGRNVATNWQNTPYRLVAFTPEQLLAKINRLELLNNEKVNVKAPRSNQAYLYMEIRSKVKNGASRLKNAIKAKYGNKQAVSMFPDFGITYKNKSFDVATNNDELLISVNQIIVGLSKHGMLDLEIGSAYWEPLVTPLQDLLSNVNITETESSTKVGEIQKLKEEILLMLRALGKLIEAENMDAPERALMNIGLFKK